MMIFDAMRECSKCGHGVVTVRYLAPWGSALPERIRRECQRCSYEWDEAPLDANVGDSGYVFYRSEKDPPRDASPSA